MQKWQIGSRIVEHARESKSLTAGRGELEGVTVAWPSLLVTPSCPVTEGAQDHWASPCAVCEQALIARRESHCSERDY